MKKLEIIYCPIGVPTFDLQAAQKEFDASINLLHSIDDSIIVPDEMLLSIDLVKSFIEDKNPDLVIIQNITFAHSAYSTELFKHLDADFLLWTLREPAIDGTRLRLNSLTGAFSAGNAFQQMRDEHLFYTFGSPQDDDVKLYLKQVIQAARMKHDLKDANLLMIGHTPTGFGFGRALDAEMAGAFGVNLMAIESRELTNMAKSVSDEEIEDEMGMALNKMDDLEKTLYKNRIDFVKLYKVYKDFIKANNIKAIASRCWPDFFTEYGTPVCGVLGLLNDERIAAACEADAYGALSMHIGHEYTQQSSFLGDPVSLDETENTITFWHCGTGACSLARNNKATTGVHPNRQIGPTMEFGFKPSENATIFRIGRKPDGTFRFFLLKGEILDKPKQFNGTSMVVQVEPKVKPLVTSMVQDGWEPHFAVLYDDVVDELAILAEMLNIEVCKY